MISCAQTTVTMAIAASIVLPSVITCFNVTLGSRLRLLGDEASFREAFSRFPNDEVNGLSQDKLKRLGQEAVILKTFADFTATCRFDDGVLHDMPMEALSILRYTAAAKTAQHPSADRVQNELPVEALNCTQDSLPTCKHLSEHCVNDDWVRSRCQSTCCNKHATLLTSDDSSLPTGNVFGGDIKNATQTADATKVLQIVQPKEGEVVQSSEFRLVVDLRRPDNDARSEDAHDADGMLQVSIPLL